jgi:fatty-acyl-CoA synthase
MLSYAHGACDEPLLGETIGGNLDRTIARTPGADALVSIHQGVRYTYAEFGQAVELLAGGMLNAGLATGDRVGVWSPNRAEWALVQYATAKLGVILVNINPAYRTSELEYALGQSGCRYLFAAPECKGSDFAAMLAQVAPRLSGLEQSIFFGSAEWEEISSGGPSRDEVAAVMDRLDFDEAINIQYTSGTTGFPKGATLTHHNLLNNANFIAQLLAYTEHDRVCVPVPLYHCFGMVIGNLACTSRGSCIVYPAETFEAEATLEACERERCTSLYGVPTMFIAELGHPRFSEFRLDTLRTGIMAGSPCPIEVMKRVNSDMGIEQISIAFGQTETSPVSTFVRVDDTLEHRCETVGQVMPHTEIKVIDPDTRRIHHAASQGSSARAGTSSCRATGTTPSVRPSRSTPRAGCIPAIWRRWTRTGMSASSAASRTWSSAAARTCTHGRSRSSSTAIRRLPTCRSSACPTSATGRS